MDIFFTQKISDFSKRTSLLSNNTDGEVDIHRPHHVTEAQCNTLDHALTADPVNSCQFLSVSPPYVSPESPLFLSKETEFYIDVIEGYLLGLAIELDKRQGYEHLQL